MASIIIKLSQTIFINTLGKFQGARKESEGCLGLFYTVKLNIVKFDNCEEKALQLFCKLRLFPEYRDNVHMSML